LEGGFGHEKLLFELNFAFNKVNENKQEPLVTIALASTLWWSKLGWSARRRSKETGSPFLG
jgi:hypothetical protein